MPPVKQTYPVNAEVICIHPDSKYRNVTGVVVGHSEDRRRVHVKWATCIDILHYRLSSLSPAPFKAKNSKPKIEKKVSGPFVREVKTYVVPPTLARPTSEQPTRHSAL